MRWPAIAGLSVLLAGGLGFAASEAIVPTRAMAAVEDAVNDKLRAPGADQYDLLGTARCTYLNGYGALITAELQLVYASGVNPFRPAYTPQEIAALHDRKMKKLPVFEDAMRNMMASSAVTLDSLPLSQKIAFEARLWRFRWEDSKGIPERIFMSAEKSKLLAAQGNPAALAAAVEEHEQ